MTDKVVNFPNRQQPERLEHGCHLISLHLFVLSDGSYRYEMHDINFPLDIPGEQNFRLYADAAMHAAKELNEVAKYMEEQADPENGVD